MVRRYEEPIEVREGARDDLVPSGGGVEGPGGLGGPRPDAFVWRGRLYVVRAVLDRWQERRPWWRDARERDGRDVLTDARERQVWRVEASAGRLAGVGVYDLGADRASTADGGGTDEGGRVGTGGAGGDVAVGGAELGTGSQWRLLRVAD